MTRLSVALFALGSACSGLDTADKAGADTGAGYENVLADDDGDDTASGGGGGGGGGGTITYPSDLMSKILMYTGHGGGMVYEPPQPASFAQVTTMWETEFGWITHNLDELPEMPNMSPYRMIGLLAPGSAPGSDIEQSFDELARRKLDDVLSRGGRVVLFAEHRSCSNGHVNVLLGELGLTMRFTGSGTGLSLVANTTDIERGSQVTEGVEVLRFRDPCYIDAGSGDALAFYRAGDQPHAIMATERIGTAGDVVLVGDMEFMDDQGNLDNGDNRILARNLVTIAPSSE